MTEQEPQDARQDKANSERFGTEAVIYPYVNRLIRRADTILDLDPSFSEADIFRILTENIVLFLEAEAAGIWLLENGWQRLAFYAGRNRPLNESETAGLFDGAVADEVVRDRRPQLVSDIWKEERWENKEPFRQFEVNSLLAVPVSFPRFSDRDADPGGVLQVYYKERERAFSSLEIEVAELFARRVSYVLARKRIKDLQKCNSIKDRVVDYLFKRLAKGEGIFMKDLFNSVIPELSGLMDIQRCALFSINRERKEIVLEAGFPEKAHGIGKTRSLGEPYIQKIIAPAGPFGHFAHEHIDPRYILITEPQKSRLIPGDIQYFLETQNIHSVLYLPLKRGEEVDYFLSFDAQGRHERFTEEEIEILLLFGMELIKGARLERLQDLLHDSKNIALSLAYYARRVKNILEQEKFPENERLNQAVVVILEESRRLEGLFSVLFEGGKEAVVDVTEAARRRFLLYQETLKGMGRDNVRFVQNEMTTPLRLRGDPAHIERMIDNLLSNAALAVPDEGGEILIRTYRGDGWGVVEIANSSGVSKEEIELHFRGEEDGEKKRKGRGLHICKQLADNMGGAIEVEAAGGFVIFRVKLPVLPA